MAARRSAGSASGSATARSRPRRAPGRPAPPPRLRGDPLRDDRSGGRRRRGLLGARRRRDLRSVRPQHVGSRHEPARDRAPEDDPEGDRERPPPAARGRRRLRRGRTHRPGFGVARPAAPRPRHRAGADAVPAAPVLRRLARRPVAIAVHSAHMVAAATAVAGLPPIIGDSRRGQEGPIRARLTGYRSAIPVDDRPPLGRRHLGYVPRRHRAAAPRLQVDLARTRAMSASVSSSTPSAPTARPARPPRSRGTSSSARAPCRPRPQIPRRSRTSPASATARPAPRAGFPAPTTAT